MSSTGERNALDKLSTGCLIAKRLPRTRVEFERDSVQIALAVDRQVCAIREVLTQQAIGFRIAASLPGTTRIAEVDVYICGDREPLVLREFLSLIHISEPTRQAEISYAVFCLKKK